MMKQTINKISQIKINDVKQNIDVAAILKDRAPKENSTNVITSGAVYTAIENLTTKDIIDENRNVDFSFNAEGALTSDMASDATNNLIVGQNNVINGVNSFVAGSSNKINNKGYHYKSYTKTVIQKDDKDVECYELELTSDCSEYAVGDQYCLTTVPYTDNKGNLVKGHHFAFCGELLKIEGNKVIVDHMPWTEHIGESITEEGLEAKLALDPTDRDGNAVFWVPTKPNAGDFLLGSSSLVVGEDNVNSGRASAVVGRENLIGDAYAFAAGRENKVGYAGFVAGRANSATADYSAALGNHCIATGRYAIAFGSQSNTAADYGIAGGYKAKVESGGDASVALGLEATAQGVGDIALNNGKTQVKKYTAAGNNQYFTYNFAANKATVEGGTLNAAFGTSKITGGDYSLVTGDGNEIKAGYSLVGGYKCKSFGAVNFVFGQEAVAGAPVDIALIKGQTYESDKWNYNAALGYDAKVSAGQFNMALIGGKVTGGNYRLAANKATATEECAIALGDYNKGENLFEIGNGTSDSPSNAFSVDNSGNVLAAGKITAGQNPDPTQPMDVVTIDYFNNNATKVEWENIDSDVKIINDHALYLSGDLTIEGNARINGELEFNGDFEFNNIVANDSISVKKTPTEDDHVVTLGYLKNEYEMPSLTWDALEGKPFGEITVEGKLEKDFGNLHFDANGEYEIRSTADTGNFIKVADRSSYLVVIDDSVKILCEGSYGGGYGSTNEYHLNGKNFSLYSSDTPYMDEAHTQTTLSISYLPGDHTVKVYEAESTIVKIPEDYLPEKAMISWEKIENKPFSDPAKEGNDCFSANFEWIENSDSVYASDENSETYWYYNHSQLFVVINGTKELCNVTQIPIDLGDGEAHTCGISLSNAKGENVISLISSNVNGYIDQITLHNAAAGSYTIKVIEAVAAQSYLKDDYIPDTIARITDVDTRIVEVHNKITSEIDAISWNDLNDRPFYESFTMETVFREDVILNNGGSFSDHPSDWGVARYVIDYVKSHTNSKYYIAIGSLSEIAEISFAEEDYTPAITLTSEHFRIELTSYGGHDDWLVIEAANGASGSVSVYIYEEIHEFAQLDNKFLSDTIARITDIENLETKHNADIAALQATIDALQAKIDALTNTAASSQ